MGCDTGDAAAPGGHRGPGVHPVPGGVVGPGGDAATPADDGFVPVLRADMGATVVADHLVLHDASTHRTHVLNAASARVWAAIDGRSTVAEISRVLAEGTGVDPTVVARNVAGAIGQFAAAAILVAPTPDRGAEPEGDEAALPANPDGPLGTDRSPGAEAGQASPTPTATGPNPATDPEPAWSVTMPRRALGAAFVVRTDDAELAALVEEVVAPYPAAERADHAIAVVRTPSGGHRVLVDDVAAGEVVDPQDAVELVVSHLNQLAVAHTAGRLLLHAGAVERAGRAVVIVGPSGRGKSTLTAALVLAGFAYLTDEVAAIDPSSGWIDPFPKPLSLSTATRELLGLDRGPRAGHEPPGTKRPVPPATLGTTSRGGRLDLLVLLEDPDPTAPALAGGAPPEGSPALTGFLALLEQTFAETMAVPDALEHLGRQYRDTPTLALPRQAVATMVRAVISAR